MFIWTTRTILVFGKKVTWYRKTLPKKRKWGKVTFWDHSKNELIHQGYVLKSSPLLGSTPQGLLFLINRHFWKFQTCPFWKKYAFPYIWAYLVPIGPYLVPIGPYLIPIGPYLALLSPIWPYWALFGPNWPYLALTVKQKRDTEGPYRGHRTRWLELGEHSQATRIKH